MRLLLRAAWKITFCANRLLRVRHAIRVDAGVVFDTWTTSRECFLHDRWSYVARGVGRRAEQQKLSGVVSRGVFTGDEAHSRHVEIMEYSSRYKDELFLK